MGWRYVITATDGTPIGELTAAKSKQVSWFLNSAATASFTIDGRHPEALLPQELATDLIVYDNEGVKRFRGRMGTSGDVIAAPGHVTTFSAVDYRGVLDRRLLFVSPAVLLEFIAADQGDIINRLLQFTTPEIPHTVPETGTIQTITFAVGAKVSDSINQMANTATGFDWEVDANLSLNLFSPQRGSVRVAVLEYGGSVLSVGRTLDTTQFANFLRFSGDPSLIPNALGPAGDTSVIGVWDLQITDTTILDQATLDAKALYEIETLSVLTPSYQLVLKDGWWDPSQLWLGDTAQVVVKSGRVNEVSQQRVSKVQVQSADDGGEVVTITTGPVPPTDVQRQLDLANSLARLELTQ